ncbi:P-loop containing nucleoside triphosphate hydrolase protein [Gymnopus androsaceus JB14]|uniref:P-loop containing nucleoside triphosphate hydrolase protein n=1 Tax=Gymnopus androsaceus JB14 TaxID=1447944 RepID=A0A6A4HHB9_9AGAR|nr:P-loop containing nucleoside triphosphate hydrolase protein [Gymnopus androsaceus JB14]
MAQAYSPTRVTSPTKELASFSNFSADRQLKVEDVQEAYIEQKDRLVNAIDATKSILNDIRTFNKDEWIIRYPQYKEAIDAVAPPSRKALRRSLTFADDPSAKTDVIVRKKMQRSVTVSQISEKEEEEEESDEAASSDFSVLRLDLKLGPNSTVASLVSQLEKSSIANLLDERIGSSLNHVDKLRLRVEDTSSKVLVTGDLNAGKSTFVNALLRREVMPVDQQPCTTAFCEVHDAAENKGTEEVHIITQGASYDINDESTFTRASLSELEEIVADNENNERILKLYLADTRTPSESLLNNGVVDISLIDAPGLNRDSLKTTALFARQEEIDVVVFVVSAENHFTLSAREFLTNASKEKAYLFIVVNKFEQIKNKDKCRRLVLEQIKQLSPRTYDNADDLVHFPFTANPTFDDLESSLRSFVLVKRSKSKLHPVSTRKESLAEVKPVLEKMKSGREALEEGLETLEEEGASGASSKSKTTLAQALERVGQGKLGVDKSLVPMPSYPGILGVWDYARDVRKALLATAGVDKIKDLSEEHLPAGVERNKRVFMPEAMFSTVRKASKGSTKSRRSLSVVAGGVHGLGIGLAQRPDMLETTFLDLFDLHHQLWLHFGDGLTNLPAPTALGLASVGVGALTMVGGQAVGAKSLIEGIIRVTDLFGNETVQETVGRRVKASVVRNDGEEEISFIRCECTRKVLRLASWDLKGRNVVKEVKAQEEMAKKATRAMEWFGEVGRKSEEIRVDAHLGIDV